MLVLLKKQRNKKGFTLIELIIIIAILGILASLLVPNMMAFIEEAREVSDVNTANTLMKAAYIALVDQSYDIPSGYVIEIAWSTDGIHSTDGSLFVRSPVATSVLSRYGAANAIPADSTLFTAMDIAISEVMGADPTKIGSGGANDYYPALIGDASSIVGNKDDFIIHIDTGTGEVAVTNESYAWVEKLGVRAQGRP